VERKTRFELATSSLARRRSTAELLPHFLLLYQKICLKTLRVILNQILRSLRMSGSKWCRGGDLNSYGLTPTTPSRWRVYLFHPLGIHCTSWQGRQDSNPRPAVLETAALPSELHPYTFGIKVEVPLGR